MAVAQVSRLRRQRKYFKLTAEQHSKKMREYYKENKEEIELSRKKRKEQQIKSIEEWLMNCDKNPLCGIFKEIIKEKPKK